jgi:hypothetical protein
MYGELERMREEMVMVYSRYCPYIILVGQQSLEKPQTGWLVSWLKLRLGTSRV